MRVGVTGASGLIGSALSTHLTATGHHVVALVRGPAQAASQIAWRPGTRLDPALLEGLDAIVHLAGAGVGDKRWTPAYKEIIRASRVQGTRTIAEAMGRATDGPRVLVCGSAIGYYADTGGRLTDESGPEGDGFLAGVVRDWEAAAAPAADAGLRIAFARTGLVVSSRGGAWQRLFPLFRAGLGGRLGSGRQYWSPISLNDEVRALAWLLAHDVSGPVNLVGPDPRTNAEITRVMGQVLRRPTILPVPAFALKAVLGEFAGETLISQRIQPGVLQAGGFTWEQPDVRSMIEWARRSSDVA
ncbi:MAG TPA: TIGR01777 family oxidoreductase [Actinomycetota bacterium]|nr:TIGR01777 family oxidoreductase [Actinomycetota bacterium]